MSQLPFEAKKKTPVLYPLIRGGMRLRHFGARRLQEHVCRGSGVGTIASVGLACNSHITTARKLL